MNIRRESPPAFTLVELLVAMVMSGILIFVVWSWNSGAALKASMQKTLQNAKTLWEATAMMTLDFEQKGTGFAWTSKAMEDGVFTPISLQDYIDALVKSGYATEPELREWLTIPGKLGKGPGDAPITANNICFKIFQISDNSASNQPLLVTANWKYRELTDQMPYGKEGFVVLNKGGSGSFFRRPADATSSNIFPLDAVCGEPYHYDTLK